jgi:hypothetical protein
MAIMNRPSGVIKIAPGEARPASVPVPPTDIRDPPWERLTCVFK